MSMMHDECDGRSCAAAAAAAAVTWNVSSGPYLGMSFSSPAQTREQKDMNQKPRTTTMKPHANAHERIDSLLLRLCIRNNIPHFNNPQLPPPLPLGIVRRRVARLQAMARFSERLGAHETVHFQFLRGGLVSVGRVGVNTDVRLCC